MKKPKYTTEKDLRILAQIKKDLNKQTPVGSQTSYALTLKNDHPELNLKSFSQSSLSRRLLHWHIEVNNSGFLEYGADHESIVNSDRLHDLLQNNNAKYCILANNIIFLKISRDISYLSMNLLLKLHPNEILSILRDEQGNLIILTFNKDSQKPITTTFKKFNLEELVYINKSQQLPV